MAVAKKTTQEVASRRRGERMVGSAVGAGPERDPESGEIGIMVGFKTAKLEVLVDAEGELAGARFVGLAHPVPYQTQGRATCAAGKKHTAPEEGCKCGFYSLKDREAIMEGRFPGAFLSAGDVLLEVWLWGTVLESEAGYRSSQQQVAGVELSPVCGLEGCGRGGVRLIVAEEIAAYDVGGSWRGVIVRCPEHSRRHAEAKVAEISGLAGLLGVEVRYGRQDEWREALAARGRILSQRDRRLMAGVSLMMAAAVAAWGETLEWGAVTRVGRGGFWALLAAAAIGVPAAAVGLRWVSGRSLSGLGKLKAVAVGMLVTIGVMGWLTDSVEMVDPAWVGISQSVMAEWGQDWTTSIAPQIADEIATEVGGEGGGEDVSVVVDGDQIVVSGRVDGDCRHYAVNWAGERRLLDGGEVDGSCIWSGGGTERVRVRESGPVRAERAGR